MKEIAEDGVLRFTRTIPVPKKVPRDVALLRKVGQGEGSGELPGRTLNCGIRFIHREGNEEPGSEPEYIAPDPLPDYAAVALEAEARRRDGLPFEAVVEPPFPHPGVMRSSFPHRKQGGMAPVRWRDGVSLHEEAGGDHARIEQRLEDDPPRLVIRTSGCWRNRPNA